MMKAMNVLEINGGQVQQGDVIRLTLDRDVRGYADAQIDDYHGLRRTKFLWGPGCELSLKARFSSEVDKLEGTAGFGFWNAPFGDAEYRWPALPGATWFFYASKSSDLPLNIEGPGRGWFVSTIDSRQLRALLLAPISPFLMVLNNSAAIRKSLWPFIRRQLKIDYHQIDLSMSNWHSYRLRWSLEGCEYWVDEVCIFRSCFAPKGKLGFVCWIDNQFLVAKPTGVVRWGTLNLLSEQWLEIADLELKHL